MAQTQFFYDEFTDTNGTGLGSHTSDSSHAWTQHPSFSPSGSGSIQTNRAYGGSTAAYWYSDAVPHTADYSVRAYFYDTGSGTTSEAVGVLGRLDDTAETGYALYRDSTTIELSKHVAGAETSLGTVTRTLESCYVELKMVGTTIEAYIYDDVTGGWVTGAGGTQSTKVACISVTDSSITDVGLVGMQLADSTSTTKTHLDWIMGDGNLLYELIEDTFTDTDTVLLEDHTGESGNSWELHGSSTGIASILSNQVTCDVNASYWNIVDTPDQDDHQITARIDFNTFAGNTAIYAGPYGRMQTGSISGYQLRMGRNEVVMVRLASGVASTLKQDTFFWGATTYELTLEFEGTAIRAYVYREDEGTYLDPSATTTWTPKRIPWYDSTDATYSSGKVGIQHCQAFYFAAETFKADDIYVYEPANPLPVYSRSVAHDISILDSTGHFNFVQDRAVPDSDLGLTQTVWSPSHPPANHVLELSSVAFGELFPEPEVPTTLNLSSIATVVFGVPHASPWGVGGVSETLAFTQVLQKIVDPNGASTLALTQEAIASYGLDSVMALTQSAIGGIDRPIESTLELTSVPTRGGSEWLRSEISTMALTSSSNAWSGDDKCGRRYAPYSPIATQGQLTLTNGQYTIVLRNPEVDNLRRTAFDRVLRETRGGNLIVYRDTSWNVVQTLLFTITALKQTTIDDLQTFFLNTLGQQITLVDWLGEEWSGVVTKPDETFTEDRDGYWTFAFEFEGNKRTGSSASQFLNLTSVATQTVVP